MSLQDINVPAKDVDLKKGQTKTLTGNEAYCYLRNRDITQFESATDRSRRQEQYLNGFYFKGTEPESGKFCTCDGYI